MYSICNIAIVRDAGSSRESTIAVSELLQTPDPAVTRCVGGIHDDELEQLASCKGEPRPGSIPMLDVWLWVSVDRVRCMCCPASEVAREGDGKAMTWARFD